MDFAKESIFFSTFTINNWVPVFRDFPESNFLILDSLNHLHRIHGVVIYAFVLMKDHMHLVWHHPSGKDISGISIKFKQYTGKEISKFIKACSTEYLENFNSDRADRAHKIWKLKSSHLRIQHLEILNQKIDYIHKNPIHGDYKTVENPEDYLFSSAKSYQQDFSNFSFLTLYNPHCSQTTSSEGFHPLTES